jgi:DNA-binding beta-propeller fold protein YncE
MFNLKSFRFRVGLGIVTLAVAVALSGAWTARAQSDAPTLPPIAPAEPTGALPPSLGSGSQGAKVAPAPIVHVSGVEILSPQKRERSLPSNDAYGLNGMRPRSAGQPNLAPRVPSNVLDPNRTLHFNNRIYPPSGAFNGPFFMTFDGLNNELYVSDYNNNRVLVYSATGSYLRQVGSSAFYNGPGGVVVNGNDIYITDCGNSRINRFDRTSTSFLNSIGIGLLSCPTGLALHPIDGFLYAVETGNHRVHKLTTGGASQGTFGGLGSGNGQFNTPYGIAIDPYGYTYVADSGNNRVSKFYTGGAFARNLGGTGSGVGQFQYPLNVVLDRAGLLYITDVNNFRIQKIDGQGIFRGQYGTVGSACSGLFQTTCHGSFNSLRGIAVSPANKVYVSDGGNQTVQVYDLAMHATGRFSDQSFGSLNTVGGVVTDSQENIYATDFYNHRVVKFDKFGQQITAWGALGTGNGQFNNPYGIAIDGSDVLYVVDSANHRVQKFNTSGVYLGQFGSLGASTGQFTFPAGIATDAFGYVYVTEENIDRIQKLDAGTGAWVRTIGSGTGTGNGQLYLTTGVAVDSTRGFVYTVEYGNNRLQVFTLYGDFVSVLATSGGSCPLNQPYQVAVDDRGQIIVNSRANNKVYFFNDYNQCIGNTTLTNPQSVAISKKNGQVFVGANGNGATIQRLGASNPRFDTIGVYRTANATFYLRNSNTQGIADIIAPVGNAAVGDLPVTGDWNGDGVDSVGIYRPSSSFFYLWDHVTNLNMATPHYLPLLGNPNDRPLAGDWDADGKDGIGTYRPSNGILYLKNALTSGFSDYFMILGNPSDSGVSGDWNGDGVDSAGIYRHSENKFYLTDRNTGGIVFSDYTVILGSSGDIPFIGDWNHQGASGVAVYRPSTGFLFLKYGLTGSNPDLAIFYGDATDLPVGGTWGSIPSLPQPPPLTGNKFTQPPILVNGGSAPVNGDDTGRAD